MIKKVPAWSLHHLHSAHAKLLLVKHSGLNADFILLKHNRFRDGMNDFKIYHNWLDSPLNFGSRILVWNSFELEFWNNNQGTVSANKFLARLVRWTEYLKLGMESKGDIVQLINRHWTNDTMLVRLNVAHMHISVDVAHGLSSSLSFIMWN